MHRWVAPLSPDQKAQFINAWGNNGLCSSFTLPSGPTANVQMLASTKLANLGLFAPTRNHDDNMLMSAYVSCRQLSKAT